MIKTITIEIELDSEAGIITGADIVEGYNRLELVGCGEEASIDDTINAIRRNIIKDYLD